VQSPPYPRQSTPEGAAQPWFTKTDDEPITFRQWRMKLTVVSRSENDVLSDWDDGRDGAMRHNEDRYLLKTRILERAPTVDSLRCRTRVGDSARGTSIR
jgi:hypothetical protein